MQIIGLCLDLLGAGWLVYGILAKSVFLIAKEASSGYGGAPNGAYIKNQIELKTETLIGAVLIVLGFLYQIIGNIQTFEGDATLLMLLSLAILIVFSLIVAKRHYYIYQAKRIYALIELDHKDPGAQAFLKELSEELMIDCNK